MKMAQLATTFGYTYKFGPAAPDRQAGQHNKGQIVSPMGYDFGKNRSQRPPAQRVAWILLL
jgi:hypothetical protein